LRYIFYSSLLSLLVRLASSLCHKIAGFEVRLGSSGPSAFLLNQQWWHSATIGLRGVSPHHEQVVSFMTRQLLDTVSPVNFIATNPEVLAATLHEGGRNILRLHVHGHPPVGKSPGQKQ